jgi:hypothetical protein
VKAIPKKNYKLLFSTFIFHHSKTHTVHRRYDLVIITLLRYNEFILLLKIREPIHFDNFVLPFPVLAAFVTAFTGPAFLAWEVTT